MKTSNLLLEQAHEPVEHQCYGQRNEQHPQHRPQYLKNGAQKYQHFINERRKNLKQLSLLRSEIETSQIICPKAWCWGRFEKLFHPKFESYWLSSWWDKSDNEKKQRFLEQLEYLATETIRFNRAYSFILNLESEHWYKSYHSSISND